MVVFVEKGVIDKKDVIFTGNSARVFPVASAVLQQPLHMACAKNMQENIEIEQIIFGKKLCVSAEP